ncbi:MAG: ZIP family metal transporter [Spirulinaceae cyanobacterium RM2_2_10]|nr:ZIP family metal transporter [Spirulinaceae cyanobacterium SM2_1_0]NJO19407.1 ZIP family metal transporter [Spirulinaceae cyanobacterium RM2_2_10]
MNIIAIGAIASLLAGLATAVGALPILFIKDVSPRWQGIFLGLGGGIMLAATAFSLIVPGLDAAAQQGASEFNAAGLMVGSILLGGALLWLIHNNFPHEHFHRGPEGRQSEKFAQIWLFVIAIALHNLPEGLAVGVGFGTGDLSQGIPLALGIGIQNMPEGLVVALALRNLNYSIASALGISLLTGVVEPVGGLLGAAAVSIAQPLLPWGLGFAAGAMLFVIVDEIIPEIDSQGLDQEGTVGVMIGFVTMMFLDVVLG